MSGKQPELSILKGWGWGYYEGHSMNTDSPNAQIADKIKWVAESTEKRLVWVCPVSLYKLWVVTCGTHQSLPKYLYVFL